MACSDRVVYGRVPGLGLPTTGHDVCIATRTFVTDVGPLLHRLCNQVADSPRMGMDLVCRVLHEAQQEHFACITARGNTGRGAVPTFGNINYQVLTHRAESLSALPAQWHTLFDAPKSSKRQSNQSPTTHQRAGAEPTFNANADTRLMTRCREAGFSTITAMMGDNEVETPKHAGKEVCLSWALKESCLLDVVDQHKDTIGF